jgi:mevalonate kinase
MTSRSSEVGGEVGAGSACGKVILLGEHAVVYGTPAIAVGIERGVRATAHAITDGPSRLFVRTWDIEVAEDDAEKDLARAFQSLLSVAPVAQPLRVEADVDLPPGGGLGCSAALGVAVARAVDRDAPDARITERAMAWERVFHGNPSGIDAAVAASGGCIQFDKERGFETVHALGGLTLCVGHTGNASSTKAMVESVARLRARRPEVVEKAFQGIQALVRNARLALEAGDRFALGRLMDLNQMILSGLFVSTPEIEHMCALARDAGADGAKLTGAGGGGCVVVLVGSEEASARVLEAWRGAKFEAFATRAAAISQMHAQSAPSLATAPDAGGTP